MTVADITNGHILSSPVVQISFKKFSQSLPAKSKRWPSHRTHSAFHLTSNVRANRQTYRVIPSAPDAARQLASTLESVADKLASDHLETISDAMIQIRVAARELARALEFRGWGGGTLYGFGEPGKAEDLAQTADEIEQMLEAGELEPGWDQEPEVPGEHLPDGRRLSIQSRMDYIIADEVAFRRYVRERVEAQPQKGDFDDELVLTNPLFMLSMLDGMEMHNYTPHGLELGGFQSLVRPVSRCLAELGWDDASDTYPTNHP